MKQVSLYSIAVLLALPVMALLLLSLIQVWAYPSLWGAGFSLENWTSTVGGSEGLLGSFFLSVFISGTMALAGTASGFLVSRYLMYHRHRRTLIGLAYYPYLVAPVILGVIWRYYFLKAGLAGTTVGVMAAQYLFVFPFPVILFSGFWSKKVRDMENQAATLGASKQQILIRVLLPTARGWIALSLVQCFLISWFEYGLTQVIGIGKVPTLTIRVMQYVKEANPHYAAVASCLMVLPLVALVLVNRRMFGKSVVTND